MQYYPSDHRTNTTTANQGGFTPNLNYGFNPPLNPSLAFSPFCSFPLQNASNFGIPGPFYPCVFSSFPFNQPPQVGNVFNAGSNANGSISSGKQVNGDVRVGNHTKKSKRFKIGRIGGNHGNRGGVQECGNVKVGNI